MVWSPVRNVGLLLIGNLVKRAFDQKSQDVESYASRQEFSSWFARYPKLLPLFGEVLEKNETEVSCLDSSVYLEKILTTVFFLTVLDPIVMHRDQRLRCCRSSRTFEQGTEARKRSSRLCSSWLGARSSTLVCLGPSLSCFLIS